VRSIIKIPDNTPPARSNIILKTGRTITQSSLIPNSTPRRFNTYNTNKIKAARRGSINRTKDKNKKERSKSTFTISKFRCIVVLIGLTTRKAYNRLDKKKSNKEIKN